MNLVSELFDTVLMIAGLVLVVVGVVMFIRSKTASAASSVEAFGIRLNVTHPSLILVLAGVGLMLAPRLLPDTVGKHAATPDKVVVAETTEKSPPPVVAPQIVSIPAPQMRPSPPAPADKSAPATPAAVPAAAPATAPVTAPASAPVVPSKPAAPSPARPKPAAIPPAPSAPPSARVAAPARPKLAAAPAPAAGAASSIKPNVAESKPTVAGDATPAPPPRPARPTVAYAALGLPVSRAFWSGETQAGYTRRMNDALRQASREVLRMDARGLDYNQAAFDTWWDESNAHARSRELCGNARALLSARVETPTTISSVESAYWPELRLRLYDCAAQRVYRQQKVLAPNREDVWPFSVELNAEIERFLRTYRADLAD